MKVTLRFFSALPAPGWGLWNVVRYVFLGENAIATMFGRCRDAACIEVLACLPWTYRLSPDVLRWKCM